VVEDEVKGPSQVGAGLQGTTPEMEAIPQPPGISDQGTEQAREGNALMSVEDVGQKIPDLLPGAIGDGPDSQEGEVAVLGHGSDGGSLQVKDRQGQVGSRRDEGGFGDNGRGGKDGAGKGRQSPGPEKRDQRGRGGRG
jgi:hypothetical protein